MGHFPLLGKENSICGTTRPPKSDLCPGSPLSSAESRRGPSGRPGSSSKPPPSHGEKGACLQGPAHHCSSPPFLSFWGPCTPIPLTAAPGLEAVLSQLRGDILGGAGMARPTGKAQRQAKVAFSVSCQIQPSPTPGGGGEPAAGAVWHPWPSSSNTEQQLKEAGLGTWPSLDWSCANQVAGGANSSVWVLEEAQQREMG